MYRLGRELQRVWLLGPWDPKEWWGWTGKIDFLAQPTCPQAYWTKARLHEGVPRRKPRKGGRGPCQCGN